tara:strand:+ start:1577 stop:2887 length:1311 start_codon:yes stop_codon:yes gene_type:complete
VLEMGTTISPSDFTEINPDYTQGRGFYTNANEVADLLQIPDFSATTYPTTAQVGAIIKRTEGIVDDKVKRSFRPIITKDEYHNFEFTRGPNAQYYGGYVGFIQLKQMKVRKIISLQLWQGSQYEEIASAQAKIRLLDNFRDLHSIILQLPDSGVSFEMVAENTLTDLANDEFCNTFGAKTTVAEIISLVNESFPSASQFTGATAPKSLTSSNLSISDFFYAAKNKENGKEIFISSLLMGDDGSDCTIKATIKQSCTTTNTSKTLTVADSSKLAVGMIVSGTGITGTVAIESITNSTTVVLDTAATASGTNTLTFSTEDLIPSVCDLTVFTDKEDLKRLGSYWTIGEEGRIFFLRDYPYHTNNSVIVSYIAGDNRVPSAIHEATTKLVAAEIIRMDDQSVLIAETGANIGAKEKYDILKKEAMDILKGKGDIVYFLD